jgi:hypothetical protein
VKVFQFARLACIAWLGCSTWASAGLATETNPLFQLPRVFDDWQYPESLPPRYRNHCSFNVTRARYYCSDHCGSDYQFFYCSKQSYGCCGIGLGHCDWRGFLRCNP